MEPVILKSRQVRREEGPVARRERAHHEGRPAEVRSIVEGGVVRAIEIRCSCGEVVTIELDSTANEG